jgi:hypothetical protein
LGSRTDIEVSALPITSLVNLGKSLHFPETHVLDGENGMFVGNESETIQSRCSVKVLITLHRVSNAAVSYLLSVAEDTEDLLSLCNAHLQPYSLLLVFLLISWMSLSF